MPVAKSWNMPFALPYELPASVVIDEDPEKLPVRDADMPCGGHCDAPRDGRASADDAITKATVQSWRFRVRTLRV